MKKRILTQSKSLLLLFSSRLAGVLVSVFFIPIYSRLLGPEQFGAAAIILSAQAMIIMLDLGMSALLSRDISAAKAENSSPLHNWQSSEKLLVRTFAILALPAILALSVGKFLPVGSAVATLLLLSAATLQNLCQVAMIAGRQFRQAANIQAIGIISRALFSTAALSLADATLQTFIFSQMIGALLHLAINRNACQRALSTGRAQQSSKANATEPALSLLRRGAPLFVVGIAGAAILQFDKMIVGAFISAKAVAPYFLASTFSMTPIALLAAPISQYFQPQIIQSVSQANRTDLKIEVRNFTLTLLAAVLIPTALISIYRHEIINLWLRDREQAALVADLASILLPAAAIGAIGNVPLALLAAMQDFKFQAKLSTLLSATTIAAVAYAASLNQLRFICWLYLLYYFATTTFLWTRAAFFQMTAPAAKSSAKLATFFTTITATSLLMPIGQ